LRIKGKKKIEEKYVKREKTNNVRKVLVIGKG